VLLAVLGMESCCHPILKKSPVYTLKAPVCTRNICVANMTKEPYAPSKELEIHPKRALYSAKRALDALTIFALPMFQSKEPSTHSKDRCLCVCTFSDTRIFICIFDLLVMFALLFCVCVCKCVCVCVCLRVCVFLCVCVCLCVCV